MMDYATFKTVVEKSLLSYLPKEFKNAKVEIKSVTKINQEQDAVVIWPDKTSSQAATFYLGQMYEQYQAFGDLEEVFRAVSRVCAVNIDKIKNISLPDITKEYVGENVVMMMINTESNQKLLENTPHREINDCSVIYRLILEKDDTGFHSVIVSNSMAEMAGMDEQELFLKAAENTKRILPADIKPMYQVILGMIMGEKNWKEPTEALVKEIIPENEMIVVSNTLGIDGAVQMLYDENLQKVAELVKDDLYILPSSIHEVVCVPASKRKPEELAEMVQDINMKFIRPEERLSNQVYHYDKELRKLTMATETPNRRVDDIVAETPLLYGEKEQRR